ncbi:MAG: Ca-activated chloride channel [Verrucomicrobiota bacterium]
MNPDLPNNPREELEAQLTSLILGELPAEQAFALGRAIEQDAGLAKLYERLKQTIQLVRETEASPTEQTAAQPTPLKLSDERRQKLLQQFKTVEPKEFVEPSRRGMRLLEVAAAVAILGILAAICLPSLHSFKSISLIGGHSSKGSVTTTTDQTLASVAADTALERAKAEVLGRQSSQDFDLSVAPRPSAKPAINTIVLPSAGELADTPNAPVTAIPPQKHGFALLGRLPPSDSAVLSGDEPELAFRSRLSKRNGGEDSFFAGDPEWVGLREKPAQDNSGGKGGGGNANGIFPNSGLDRSDTNRFLSRYAYTVAPEGNPLNDSLDFNRNGAVDPTTGLSASAAGPGGGGGGGGTIAAVPSPGMVFQSGVPNHRLGEFSTGTKKAEQLAERNLTTEGAVEAGVVSGTSSVVPLPQGAFPKSGESTLAPGGVNAFGGDIAAGFAPGEPKAKRAELATDSPNINRKLGEDLLRGHQESNNSYNANIVGYVNVLIQTNSAAIASNQTQGYDNYAFNRELSQLPSSATEAQEKVPAQYAKSSPIALPSLQPETSLPHEERGKEVALALTPQVPGIAAATEHRRKEQEARVREAQSNVDRLRKELKIPDAMVGGDAPLTLKENKIELSPRKPSASAPIPQPEVQTHDNPFSTFSLNVSDVSFKLAAASLEKGVMPEPATVRSEEFINAFDYRDPEPPPGVPVAFAWERASYPFAQNRDLLRFSIKTAAQGREPGRPLNIVLLLDNSGSMERADRVRIIHEALRVLAAQLQAQDKLSVVTFSRTARLWVDGVPGDQAGQVAKDLGKLTPEGGTNLEEAMNLAYQTAVRHYLTNGINRVVLLTDGAANLGNVEPEVLKQKVESQRKQGIALDCFGIGWEGLNDDLLEVLSRNGDGRYGFINTPEEATTEFAGQLAGALHVAASDVKVQVEFNPARVTAYRQIGYAKHQLTKEQFRDNTVDAAEIGAAESGNALYTIEVNPRGEGPLATVRVRYKVPGTAEYHEHEWAVPYPGNAVLLEHACPAMRLAATASAFSEWLVSSPYAGEVTPDRLLGFLSGVPEVYGADARPKKLEWMIRQAKSIAGK